METNNKWEYLVIDVFLDGMRGQFQGRLNLLGAAGWELVAMTGNNTHLAVLKRRAE